MLPRVECTSFESPAFPGLPSQGLLRESVSSRISEFVGKPALSITIRPRPISPFSASNRRNSIVVSPPPLPTIMSPHLCTQIVSPREELDNIAKNLEKLNARLVAMEANSIPQTSVAMSSSLAINPQKIRDRIYTEETFAEKDCYIIEHPPRVLNSGKRQIHSQKPTAFTSISEIPSHLFGNYDLRGENEPLYEPTLLNNLHKCLECISGRDNKIKFMMRIHNLIKNRSINKKKLKAALIKKFAINPETLEKVTALITSRDFGVRFHAKDKILLKATLIEIKKKPIRHDIFDGKNKDYFRLYLVSSFNKKLIEQNYNIQHVSSRSIFDFIHLKKLHDRLNLRPEILEKINKIALIDSQSESSTNTLTEPVNPQIESIFMPYEFFSDNSLSHPQPDPKLADFQKELNEHVAEWNEVYDAIRKFLPNDILIAHRPIDYPEAKRAKL